ncbi:DUF1822 family protein [Brasilonema octagenarum]|uniref:DUF1822 family protein n=1 Tax=Brasilonema octagenarum UFV-OR1 TaxID=417115 RepID=A0ABX1MBY3_9CYAN|nr:DUF1822 family protein [Brasilonema octagenarum]NMF66127.1 hypothetical protein [Brasilonema octagenarum UFV-OR1]
MKLNLQELRRLYPEQIWQEFSEKELKQRESTIRRYSNQTAQNNADLNFWCLNAFRTWLKENLGDSITVLPSEADLPTIWDVVNGTAITIGKTRLVLIPDEATDTETLTVSQEWVDIPDWVADYYLAIQVNIDAGWMCVWGFTSHRTLKDKGNYDPIYRTYSLERDYVITDLDVLWLAPEMGLEEKANVEQLKFLSHSTAKDLLVRLSKPSPYSPRLDVSFQEWGTLLASNNWRNRLYEMRQEKASGKLKQFIAENYALVSNGWQDIQAFFSPEKVQVQLDYSLRNTTEVSNSSLHWQGKLIYLKKEITVLLKVAFIKEADGRVGVCVQVYPGSEETYLPANLKLALLSNSEVLESVTSGKSSLYIELPYFKCQLGTQFCIEIALQDSNHVENFYIY